MTLEQLRIFVSVAERLHMTRGAEALNISQSGASAAVASLEAGLGLPLFERVGRRLELSEAGRVFLPEARAVLARARAAGEAVADLGELRSGAVVIAASQTVASYWLARHMIRFATAYPGIALELVVGNTQGVAERVADGAADLGFVEGRVDNPLLARRRVGGDRLALYAAPDHPLAEAGRVGAADLAHARWVLRERGSGSRAELERALAEHGVDPAGLQVLLQLPSNEAVLAAVETGGCVCAVSDLAARTSVAAGRLAPIRFGFPPRDFELLTHRQRGRSRAAAAFLALLDADAAGGSAATP